MSKMLELIKSCKAEGDEAHQQIHRILDSLRIKTARQFLGQSKVGDTIVFYTGGCSNGVSKYEEIVSETEFAEKSYCGYAADEPDFGTNSAHEDSFFNEVHATVKAAQEAYNEDDQDEYGNLYKYMCDYWFSKGDNVDKIINENFE